MILAGDVGGTNFRLATFELDGRRLRRVWRATYPSRGTGWTEVLRRARAEGDFGRLICASLAVAGPVEQGEARLTNLGWRISTRELAGELGLSHAGLLNDLEAAAHGLDTLEPSDFAVLQTGASPALGNRVLCAPGTGLGEAGLLWDGRRHLPVSSEGGHATFSPVEAEDFALALHLGEKHGHVSFERVLSGPGIVALYGYLRDVERMSEPEWLARELEQGDPAAVITRAALEERCPIAVRTLELFTRLLGVELSNLALKFMALGGAYLGGGIPPRVRAALEGPSFLRGFLHKGRMRPLLERVPVRIVLEPDCALRGAARHAALEAGLVS